MEHLPPVGWADVARRSDLDNLATTLRLEMQATESRLETQLGQKLDDKFSRLDLRIDRLMDAMRRDTRNFFVATLMAVFAAVGGSLGGVAALTH